MLKLPIFFLLFQLTNTIKTIMKKGLTSLMKFMRLYTILLIRLLAKWTAYWNLICQICVYLCLYVVSHNNRCSDVAIASGNTATLPVSDCYKFTFNIKHQVSESNAFGWRCSEKRREKIALAIEWAQQTDDKSECCLSYSKLIIANFVRCVWVNAWEAARVRVCVYHFRRPNSFWIVFFSNPIKNTQIYIHQQRWGEP